jgi:hypothetical protein
MGTQKIFYQKEDNTIFIGLNIAVIFKSEQNMTSYEQIIIQYVSKLKRLKSNVYKFYNNKFSMLVLCTQVNMMFVMLP